VTWLITGGAGYIGAHVVRAFLAAGVRVVVLDDLSSGRSERVPEGVPLVVAAMSDRDALRRVLREHHVAGAVHLAGRKQVAESVALPLFYYRENVGGCESLLQAMLDVGVHRLVFSSSAAVYGVPGCGTVTESSPVEPVNPYGTTKLVCERMISDVGNTGALDWVALRYFNVAGAAAPALGDPGASNLIPMIFDALSRGRPPTIFGADYPTPDGTCVRDFIHVGDLADAHLCAVRALQGGLSAAVYNVGRGRGASVREVIDLVAEVTGQHLAPCLAPRRPGDPPSVVADATRITAELGWRPDKDLGDMVGSAWASWSARSDRRMVDRRMASVQGGGGSSPGRCGAGAAEE
jgi:UDP-glucose 4-epimerase